MIFLLLFSFFVTGFLVEVGGDVEIPHKVVGAIFGPNHRIVSSPDKDIIYHVTSGHRSEPILFSYQSKMENIHVYDTGKAGKDIYIEKNVSCRAQIIQLFLQNRMSVVFQENNAKYIITQEKKKLQESSDLFLMFSNNTFHTYVYGKEESRKYLENGMNECLGSFSKDITIFLICIYVVLAISFIFVGTLYHFTRRDVTCEKIHKNLFYHYRSFKVLPGLYMNMNLSKKKECIANLTDVEDLGIGFTSPTAYFPKDSSPVCTIPIRIGELDSTLKLELPENYKTLSYVPLYHVELSLFIYLQSPYFHQTNTANSEEFIKYLCYTMNFCAIYFYRILDNGADLIMSFDRTEKGCAPDNDLINQIPITIITAPTQHIIEGQYEYIISKTAFHETTYSLCFVRPKGTKGVALSENYFHRILCVKLASNHLFHSNQSGIHSFSNYNTLQNLSKSMMIAEYISEFPNLHEVRGELTPPIDPTQFIQNVINSDPEFAESFKKLQTEGKSIRKVMSIKEPQRWITVNALHSYDDTIEKDIILVMFEDVSELHINEIKIQTMINDFQLASKLIGIHRFTHDQDRELILENDSLIKDLGYTQHDLHLNSLLYGKDVIVRPTTNQTVRFQSANNQIRYYAMCWQSETKGILFSVQNMAELQNAAESARQCIDVGFNNNLFGLFLISLSESTKKSPILSQTSYDDFIKTVEPEFRDLFAKEKLENLTDVTTIEARFNHGTDQEYKWFSFYLIPSNKQIIAFIMNTNEKHETLAKLRYTEDLIDMALSFTHVHMWEFNPIHQEDQILTTDIQSRTMIGWETIDYNVPVEFQGPVHKAFNDALNGISTIDIEIPILIERYRWILIRGVKIDDVLRGIFIDLTEVKEAYIELEKAKKEAEEAINAKSKFLASISHNVLHPLNSICGLIDVLCDSNLTNEQSELANCVYKSVMELLELVNDTLDLALIENGSLTPNDRKFAISDVLVPLVVSAYIKAKGKNTIIRTMSKPDESTMYMGDPYIFSRVIANLFSNSIKFSNSGTIDVIKSTIDGMMAMTITDTGCGMSPEKCALLQEHFDNSHNIAAGESGSVGIGLSLVTEMVKLVNGKIRIKSEEGKGTSITTLFPFEPILFPYIPNKMRNITREITLIAQDKFNRNIMIDYLKFYNFNVVIKDKLEPPYDSEAYIIETEDESIEDTILNVINSNQLMPTQITLISGSPFAKVRKIIYFFVKPIRLVLAHAICSHLHYKKNISPTIFRRINCESSTNLGYNVLSIIDKSSNKLVLMKILERLHCTMDDAVTLDDAFDLTSKNHYDVIIIDHADIASLATQFRSHSITIPILGITSENLDKYTSAIMSAGVTVALNKPIFAKTLSNALTNMVSK